MLQQNLTRKQIIQQRINAWARRMEEEEVFPLATIATDGDNEIAAYFEDDDIDEMLEYMQEAVSMIEQQIEINEAELKHLDERGCFRRF